MNNEILELKMEKKEIKQRLEEIDYVMNQINYILQHYEKLFKKEESILSLERLRKFNQVKRNEWLEARKKRYEIDKKLTELCAHEVLVGLGINDFWCPICEQHLLFTTRDYPETTKYIVKWLNNYNNNPIMTMMMKMVSKAMENENNFMEEIEEELEEIQYHDNVKVLRRE